MNDYIAALEHERQIRRLLGDRTRDPRMAEARAKTAAALSELSTVERDRAPSLAWLADPAEYDRRDAEADAAGTPIEQRPRKFYWDIPAFPRAHYEIDVSWDFLEQNIAWFQKDYGLDLDPDFQRAHVWTVDQRRRYVEYQLQGGEVGSTLIFNHTAWRRCGRSCATIWWCSVAAARSSRASFA